MERAESLIAPYTAKPGVRGVYLVGSASRPFRDATSDYDLEVVLDDGAYAAMPLAERHVFFMDPDQPKRVDDEFYMRPWAEMLALRDSTRDVDHYPFANARLLFDPSGDLATLFAELAAMPDAVRETRTKVHFLEFVVGVRRTQKCVARCEALNTRLIAAGAVEALVKLLFVARGLWPSTRHWSKQELLLAGADAALLEAMEAALAHPTDEAMDDLLARTKADLEGSGVTVQRDWTALREWAFLTDEGKRACATWGAR